MKIIKYKKLTNGRYKLTTDEVDLLVYEEVILKYNLLITKEITTDIIDSINKDNQFYEVYYTGLNSIKTRFKSTYDTKELLLKKAYPNEVVEEAIEKLVKQGYLNDLSFTKSFINNQIVTTNNGPIKIKNELLKHKVDESFIDQELVVFSDDLQLEKIDKLVSRFYKTNRTRGGNVLKRKIYTDLVNYGYSSHLIESILNEYDFSNDNDLAKKEYDKLYRKLSRKYEGSELKRKINEKMFMKGLKYEEE